MTIKKLDALTLAALGVWILGLAVLFGLF